MSLTVSEKVQTAIIMAVLLAVVWGVIVAAALFFFGLSNAIG